MMFRHKQTPREIIVHQQMIKNIFTIPSTKEYAITWFKKMQTLFNIYFESKGIKQLTFEVKKRDYI